MTLINFRLARLPDSCPPESDSLANNWFTLTDGELWLEFPDAKIYEYSEYSHSHFSLDTSQFNIYYICRFIEDFSEIFNQIADPLPDFLHQVVTNNKTLKEYQLWATKYLERDYQKNNQLDENLEVLLSWIYRRALPAPHLVGGPTIWFFRIHHQIQIIWRADYKITPEHYLWTHPYGEYRMDFKSFVKEVEDFGQRFFIEMYHHIANASCSQANHVDVHWEQIQNKKRRTIFETDCKSLIKSNLPSSRWDVIRRFYNNNKRK